MFQHYWLSITVYEYCSAQSVFPLRSAPSGDSSARPFSSGAETTTKAAAKRPGPQRELLAAGIGPAGGKLGLADSRISRNSCKLQFPSPGFPQSPLKMKSVWSCSPENGLVCSCPILAACFRRGALFWSGFFSDLLILSPSPPWRNFSQPLVQPRAQFPECARYRPTRRPYLGLLRARRFAGAPLTVLSEILISLVLQP